MVFSWRVEAKRAVLNEEAAVGEGPLESG